MIGRLALPVPRPHTTPFAAPAMPPPSLRPAQDRAAARDGGVHATAAPDPRCAGIVLRELLQVEGGVTAAAGGRGAIAAAASVHLRSATKRSRTHPAPCSDRHHPAAVADGDEEEEACRRHGRRSRAEGHCRATARRDKKGTREIILL
jgi:hypothetical protein